jgi:SAM-dependent methyltransferase
VATDPRLAALPDRARAALREADLDGVGLEIGPSYNPIAPRSAGLDIRILDHATREGLLTKYRALGLSEAELTRIDAVDYVWTGGPITGAIPADQRFDYIVAAHVIEHTTDLIGFLQAASTLLAPGGVLSLIVPDKRYCFDRLRPLTTAGQVVEAHLLPRTFHGPAAFIDTHLYSVRNHGSEMVWDATSATRLELAQCSWAAVRHTISTTLDSDEYHDIHRWVFTPTSLELMLSDLHHLGYIDMELKSLEATDSFEFFATLVRAPRTADPAAAVAHPDRLELLRRMADEDPSFTVPGARETPSSYVARRARQVRRRIRSAQHRRRTG